MKCKKGELCLELRRVGYKSCRTKTTDFRMNDNYCEILQHSLIESRIFSGYGSELLKDTKYYHTMPERFFTFRNSSSGRMYGRSGRRPYAGSAGMDASRYRGGKQIIFSAVEKKIMIT